MNKLFPLLPLLCAMTSCATDGDLYRDEARAFRVAQATLLSTQQVTLATCSVPEKTVVACAEAIDLLQKGAQWEAIGAAALSAENSTNIAEATLQLTGIAGQLSALELGKAN